MDGLVTDTRFTCLDNAMNDFYGKTTFILNWSNL